MGFDIQRLAELLKLAEDHNRSQSGNGEPRQVEAKTMELLIEKRLYGQVDPFEPISSFLMDSSKKFCLDTISIMYVGQKFPQSSEQVYGESVTEFKAILDLYKKASKEQIINQMNKPALSVDLKHGFRRLGIVVPNIINQ